MSSIEQLTRISELSGYLSLTVWFFAQLPQIIENHINQSVNGVNVMFLTCWILGDVTNLIGCLLTRALPLQTLIAGYYCFIDVILSFQYWYYTRIFPYHVIPHNLLQSPNQGAKTPGSRSKDSSGRTNRFDLENGISLPRNMKSSPINLSNNLDNSFVNKILKAGLIGKQIKPARSLPTGRAVVTTSTSTLALFLSNHKDDIGKALAWICSCFYLSSRSPQILTNYRNKSTKGLSPLLFLFAMIGNILYTISIAFDLVALSQLNDDSRFHRVLHDEIPFLIGSGGAAFFDMIILMQVYYYKPSAISKRIRTSSLEQFKPPDWYTNNHSSSWDNYGNQIDENTELLQPTNSKNSLIFARRGSEHSVASPFKSPPPPHHYVSGMSFKENSTTNNNLGLNILNSITKSVSQANSIRSQPISMPESYTQSPPSKTAMIPSIINSYSSVSKKMQQESKTPFLPSDFLNDEYHNPVENSSFDMSSPSRE